MLSIKLRKVQTIRRRRLQYCNFSYLLVVLSAARLNYKDNNRHFGLTSYFIHLKQIVYKEKYRPDYLYNNFVEA